MLPECGIINTLGKKIVNQNLSYGLVLLLVTCFQRQACEEGMLPSFKQQWEQFMDSRVFVGGRNFVLCLELKNISIAKLKIITFVLYPKLLYLLQIKVESPFSDLSHQYIFYSFSTGNRISPSFHSSIHTVNAHIQSISGHQR